MNLSTARILVTNDDGIHAPGLVIMEQIAKSISKDVWIIAPETEQSGAAHSLTLHSPLRVRKISPRKYAVSGTPTDCVMLGKLALVDKKKKINLVLSGVNRGENVSEDVTYSGTIAAAMEGSLVDIPSIAVSLHFTDEERIQWDTALAHVPGLIKKLFRAGWPRHRLININVPDVTAKQVKGVQICPQGVSGKGDKLITRKDPKGRTYYWISGSGKSNKKHKGTDVACLHEGYITVTPLSLDLTDYKTLESLHEAVES